MPLAQFGVQRAGGKTCPTRTSALLEGVVMSVHAWKEIVKQIERESDPAKIAELAKKLNEEMIAEETEKVRNRLSMSPHR